MTPFAPDLWLVDGPTLHTAGFGYPTRMAVIRLASGQLWVWSPVALTAALRAALEREGPVAHLVAPSKLHNTWLADWAAAFPDAKVHGAPGLRRRRPDLPIGADLTDTPDPAWQGEIDQVVLRGNRIAEEVAFLHRASSTVLICDMLQQFEAQQFTGWRRTVARLDGMVATAPTVPRKFRLAWTNRAAGRAAVRTLLDWPAERLVIAHGAPVETGAGPELKAAFRWLTG